LFEGALVLIDTPLFGPGLSTEESLFFATGLTQSLVAFLPPASPTKPSLLSGRQWPGMNYEDRSVVVDQKSNLNRPPATAVANHIETIVADCPRRSRMPDNRFDFFDRHPVFRGVIDVPRNHRKAAWRAITLLWNKVWVVKVEIANR
jgi:hypothetical protein